MKRIRQLETALGCKVLENVMLKEAVMSWGAITKGLDSQLVGDLMMRAHPARFGASQTVPHMVDWLLDNCSYSTASSTIQFARMLELKAITKPILAALDAKQCTRTART